MERNDEIREREKTIEIKRRKKKQKKFQENKKLFTDVAHTWQFT